MEFFACGASFGHSPAGPAPANNEGFKRRDSVDCAASLRGVELPVMTLKHRKDGVARTRAAFWRGMEMSPQTLASDSGSQVA